jgi:hypothetical protein
MATEQEINQCLTLLTAAFPEWQKNLPGQTFKQTFHLYMELLADLPPDALKEATLRHIRESKFFPKISELRELTFMVRQEGQSRGITMRSLPSPPPTVDERIRVKALIAQLAEKHNVRPTLH